MTGHPYRTLSLRVCGALAAGSICAAARAAEYVVAPGGSDANPGTKARPLATLQAAVNRLQPGDTCLVRGGVYRETVTFPRSGTAERPIIVKPFGDGEVVVSGCDPVAEWAPLSNGIWKAAMPWTLGTGRNQVFCGGQVMVEARFPNAPEPGLELPVADLSPLWPTYGAFSIPKETRVSQPGRIVSALLAGQPDDYWKGALYCGVHFEGWCAQTGVIESSKPGEICVGDRTQGWWFGSAYGGGYAQDHEEGRGLIVGHLHALDAPAEWHWQDGSLYLIPPSPGAPRAVEAKRRQLAFDLSGRAHIRLEGLSVRAASMRLENAERCTVDGCDLAYIAHYTRHYSIGQVERGRDTVKSGETGLYVSGRDNAFLNCRVRFSAGAGFHLRGYHHTIHNCLIDEVSYVGHYLNAITDAVTDFNDYENFLVGGHAVTFNTMRNAGRHFFNFYGNGTSQASRDRGPMDYAATLFAHNHLYNGMLLTRDAGFLSGYFCSGGTLNGQRSQVAYNVMHDCYDLAAIRWNKLGLVYLDEGTCDVDVHHNLFWAAPGSLQRDLWFNTCCVGVSEYDNVFHGLFARTCAELKAEDFPCGQPFRFGHDFARPPAAPAWPQLANRRLALPAPGGAAVKGGDCLALGRADGEPWQTAVLRFASEVKALNADRAARAAPRHRQATDPLVLEAKVNDGAHEKLRMQWTFYYNLCDGAWVRYAGVPLGPGYRRIRAVYGNDGGDPWRLEVRLDRVDGPLVATAELPQTDRPRAGHTQLYREAVAELAPEAAGTRDVFLVFRSAGGEPTVDFEYARFEQSRGELPLHTGEVKLELRAGGAAGAKLGEFYPRYTGGAASVREFVARLDTPPPAGEPLSLVVRSALDGPLGTVEGLRLERGLDPLRTPGLGAAPRRAWLGLGGLVLPEPTNRPQARPADRFRDAGAARPLYRASRLSSGSALDACNGRAIELSHTQEGAAAEGPNPQAWFGCDEASLTVAVRVPLSASKARRAQGGAWGAADGGELALQRAGGAAEQPTLTLRGWRDGRFLAADEAGVPEALRARLSKEVAYRTAQSTNAWTCEWRIPLSVFGADKPFLLNANLAVRDAGADTWRVWRQAGGATYDLRNGGTVLLGSPAALPAGLRESLAVWLDASDAKTVERDAAGGVQLWRDKSGRGRDAAQSDARYRPGYRAAEFNGKPALQFEDTRQMRLDVPDLSDRPIDVTVLAVFSNPEPGLPQNHNSRIFTASDGKGLDYLCGISCNVPGTETGGPRLITFAGKDRWAKHARVGCFSPNRQTFFKGAIAEILVFDRELTPDERFSATAYLTAKWEL